MEYMYCSTRYYGPNLAPSLVPYLHKGHQMILNLVEIESLTRLRYRERYLQHNTVIESGTENLSLLHK